MKKVAIVTGSSRGIGLGCIKALMQQGCVGVVSDVRPAEDMGDLLSELSALGECTYVKCDITSAEDRKNLIDTVIEKYGRIDFLVNNAGIAPAVRADILETTEQSFDRVIGVNLRGTYFMTQAMANAMVALLDKGLEDYTPRIVNISSNSAYTSSTSRGEYCISKAGVSMITTLFADRLAEFGIPVFEVRPGIIKTDMTATVTEKYQKLIDGGITPIKRFGLPEDVANCVAAACSGMLDFGTGTVLNADGGFHMRRL